MKKYTKAHHDMISMLYAMEKELGRLPDMAEICEHTGKLPKQVFRGLSNIDFYPKELLLTQKEKQVIEVYRKGLTVKEVATMTGITETNTSKIMKKLSEKGLIDHKPKKMPKKATDLEDEEAYKPTYIRVTQGRLKGAAGYLRPTNGPLRANLYLEGRALENVPLRPSDYVNVTRREA